jgi:hypothetical protein
LGFYKPCCIKIFLIAMLDETRGKLLPAAIVLLLSFRSETWIRWGWGRGHVPIYAGSPDVDNALRDAGIFASLDKNAK